MTTFKGEWVKRITAELDFYKDPKEIDLFANWEKIELPETTPAFCLSIALSLLYADRKDLAPTFIALAIQGTDRILSEDKCRSPLCNASFPRNLGVTLRTNYHARSLKGAGPLPERYVEAADHFEKYADTYSKEQWIDSHVQSCFLGGVRLRLLGGDRTGAKASLEKRHDLLKEHRDQRDALGLLCAAVGRGAGDEMLARFDTTFDRLRSPVYNRSTPRLAVSEEIDIQRFELGVLRQMYLIAPDRVVSLDAALNAISR